MTLSMEHLLCYVTLLMVLKIRNVYTIDKYILRFAAWFFSLVRTAADMQQQQQHFSI